MSLLRALAAAGVSDEVALRGAYVPTGFPAQNLGTVRDSIYPLQMSEEFVVTTPQPVYVLPRDHKFHGGEFYSQNDFWEWHYWSGFGKDDAGKEYAIFFGSDPVGYDPKTGKHAFMPNVISISPLDEGKKYYYFGSLPEVEARYPQDTSSKQDFEYEMKDSASGWVAREQYYAKEERWTYKMDSGRKEDPMLDLEMVLDKPGYVARTPTGIEDEGYNYRGSYNPQTMAGLSYYYIAPKMPFKGKARYNGTEVNLRGNVWFEHQWGNIKLGNGEQENCRWRWFSFRFNNGTDLAFRHWVIPPDNQPVQHRNHYCRMLPDGKVEYGYPSTEMRFTPVKAWKVDGVDAQWDMEGLMTTPWGNFYLKPLVLDSVFVSKTGMTFWEGPLNMHEGDSNGPVIGKAYCEQYFQPSGGPAKMRTREEFPIGREEPLGGVTPNANPKKLDEL